MKRNDLREEIIVRGYFSGIYFRDFSPKWTIPQNEPFSGQLQNTHREIKKNRECITYPTHIPTFTNSNLGNNSW